MLAANSASASGGITQYSIFFFVKLFFLEFRAEFRG
jgi:hypothetical protein